MATTLKTHAGFEQSIEKPHFIARIWTAIRRLDGCARRARSRQALAQLDERLLDDIGLTRTQVNQEVRKGFFEG